jgi:hypothetical protein
MGLLVTQGWPNFYRVMQLRLSIREVKNFKFRHNLAYRRTKQELIQTTNPPTIFTSLNNAVTVLKHFV